MPKPTSELPDNQVTPNPNLEKRTRRYLSPEYKLRILAQADACRHGELGELLRREKLFSSQLTSWRKERDAGGGLDKSAPDPVLHALRRQSASSSWSGRTPGSTTSWRSPKTVLSTKK